MSSSLSLIVSWRQKGKRISLFLIGLNLNLKGRIHKRNFTHCVNVRQGLEGQTRMARYLNPEKTREDNTTFVKKLSHFHRKSTKIARFIHSSTITLKTGKLILCHVHSLKMWHIWDSSQSLMDGKFSHPHLSVQLCLWRECFKPCLKKTSSSGLLSSAGRREGGGQMGVPRQIPFPIVLPSQLSWTLPLLTVPCCPHPNILKLSIGFFLIIR